MDNHPDSQSEELEVSLNNEPLVDRDLKPNKSAELPLQSLSSNKEKIEIDLVKGRISFVKNYITNWLENQFQLFAGVQNQMKSEYSKHIEDLKEAYNFLENQINSINCQINRENCEGIKQRIGRGLTLIQTLQQDNERIEKDKGQLNQRFQNLVAEYNTLCEERNSLIQKYRLSSDLWSQNQYLKKMNDQLQQQLNEVASERSSLISQLAYAQRNPETSSISGDHPQNHLLVHEFKQIKDQEFHSISNKIFSYLSEIKPDIKANRKQEVAKIKAILVEYILIKGISFFAEDQFSEDTLSNAVNLVTNSLTDTLGIDKNPSVIGFLENNLGNLIKQLMSFNEGEAATSYVNSLDNEESFNQAVQSTKEYLYSDLQIEVSSISETLKSEIDDLVKKGLTLVKRIASADPPGILMLPQKDEPFNPEQHQAMLGYDESGKVDLAIFPAYIVGNRVFEKAIVITAFDNENVSSDVNKYPHKSSVNEEINPDTKYLNSGEETSHTNSKSETNNLEDSSTQTDTNTSRIELENLDEGKNQESQDISNGEERSHTNSKSETNNPEDSSTQTDTNTSSELGNLNEGKNQESQDINNGEEMSHPNSKSETNNLKDTSTQTDSNTSSELENPDVHNKEYP